MLQSNPHFPVNILLANSSHLFEILCDQYELKFSIENGLSNKIKLECTDRAIDDVGEIKTHYDECNNIYYQIHIWDNYCQFLWILCYVSQVFCDEMLKEYVSHSPSSQRYEEAFRMFKAGMGLFNTTSPTCRGVFWEYPNPLNNSDDIYVQAANRLFEISLCFIISHEYSHFVLGHVNSNIGTKFEEFDADYNAFTLMYDGRELELKKYLSLGYIITLGSFIFADNTLNGGCYHPDPDDRLGRILDNMNDLDSEGKDYCYAMATIIYKMWAFEYNLVQIIPHCTTVENMQQYFMIIQRAFNTYKQQLSTQHL